MAASEIGAVIVCDDVRREQTGKDILIGVYSGSIVITTFPFQLPLALWIEFLPNETGAQELFFRVTYKGSPFGTMKISLGVEVIDSVGIPIAGLVAVGDSEGDLLIEYSKDGSTWELIKKKAITKGLPGSVPSFIPSPPAPPSS